MSVPQTMLSKGTRFGIVSRHQHAHGSTRRYLLRLANTLQDRGYPCVLFTTEAWPDTPRETDPFETIHRLSTTDPVEFADALRGLDPRSHCDLIFSLERVWDCDFYRAVHGVYDSQVQHQSVTDSAFRRLFRSMEKDLEDLERSLLTEVQPVVFSDSEFVKHELIHYYDLPWERIHVIYPGHKAVNVTDEESRAVRDRLGLKEDDVLVLFAGSDWERQGLPQAIKAVTALKSSKIHFVVAGEGKISHMPDGPARFLGLVMDEMPALQEAADLFLQPSVYDAFSQPCLEAAFRGVPVITSTANGFAELLLHGHQGEAIPHPAQTKHLATAIERWISSEKREKKRPEIQKWAHLHTTKRSVAETLSIVLDE